MRRRVGVLRRPEVGLADILRPHVPPPRAGSQAAADRARHGVAKSAEYLRVQRLPRRMIDLSVVVDLTPLYEVKGCRGCPLCRDMDGRERPVRLRPIQSAALWEAELAGGLLAPMGVGSGKTLTALLLPDAMRSERAVILVKPRLLKQMVEEDVPLYSRHFRLPLDRITFVKYSQLEQQAQGVGALPKEWKWLAYLSAALRTPLDEAAPDLIIPDEAHSLLGDSMRARKFRHYMKKNPRTRCCPLSGTLGDKSVKLAEPLGRAALRNLSPYPANWSELDDWARATDPGDPRDGEPMDPGALLDLCGPADLAEELDKLDPDDQARFVSQDSAAREVRRVVARRILRRRVVETPGVCATSELSVGCGLVLRARPLEVPPAVVEALQRLRRTWTAPGGEELRQAMDVARVARQLALGFYYRWDWPGGEPDKEWLEARAAWGRFVRHALRYLHRPGMESPRGVEMAVERGDLPGAEYTAWRRVRDRWRPAPPRSAVWLSDFAVADTLAWMTECERARAPGLVWYEHVAFVEALAARGAVVFRDGEDADRLKQYRGMACAVSVRNAREGLNLQHFRRNLYAPPMADGGAWEQSLGRTHRPGQEADEVEAEAYVHDRALRSALAKAIAQERYAQDVRGTPRRLAVARREGLDFMDEGEEWPD